MGGIGYNNKIVGSYIKASKFMKITVIDDNNLRGVLAPAKLLTKELLGDILDLVAYSKPKISVRINHSFKKARKESLIEGGELKKSLGLS